MGLLLSGCGTTDLYEKVVTIPGQEWKGTYQPRFTFAIRDTTAAYQLYLILRHNARYNYNNIWLNIQATMPGGKTERFRIEAPLAAGDKGWLGSGMDDLYEQRIPVTFDPARFRFGRAGNYTFTIEHIMREEPLRHIMNVGLRVEKKPQ
ncbi:MAG TPA: gliding motility lipoprotein GldH [Chitinophagaceae bacterium]|jgi:gliding motility-associated lipoprotein GldH|nr:gliding motility lipoprotein GldH [Chitinophagaceae bacterium]